MAERILVVEDEASVAEAVCYALEREGFVVETVAEGGRALERFAAEPPDLVILDLMLPGFNGWRLFSAFRRQAEVPVIMLTARAEETDRVAGLEMGADDYVTKPFSMRELIARVRAVLRRSAAPAPEEEEERLAAGPLRMDLARREATLGGRQLQLAPKEFDLLAYLMRHPGRVRSRQQILATVWGQDTYIDERTVDVHVHWLRAKLEEPGAPRRLLTVRGTGYKLVAAE